LARDPEQQSILGNGYIMIRKPETIDFWVGRLPHWEVVDGRYFVTIHHAGAIPESGHRRIHAISAELAQITSGDQRLRLQRLIFREIESWLDRAECVRHLHNAVVAEMVVEAIEHRAKQAVWRMFEFVVMPRPGFRTCVARSSGKPV
jgi:hypothetical protein